MVLQIGSFYKNKKDGEIVILWFIDCRNVKLKSYRYNLPEKQYLIFCPIPIFESNYEYIDINSILNILNNNGNDRQ